MKYALSALHCFNAEETRKSLFDVLAIAGRYRSRDEFSEKPELVSDAYCLKDPPTNEQVCAKYQLLLPL